jgi:hypothetical protein
MSFEQWLSLYKNAHFNETRVSLLSYLEQGMVKEPKKVETNIIAADVINNILLRVYKLA